MQMSHENLQFADWHTYKICGFAMAENFQGFANCGTLKSLLVHLWF
jgi:hypothetical protein